VVAIGNNYAVPKVYFYLEVLEVTGELLISEGLWSEYIVRKPN
jgi:hypothetical protein